MKKLLITASALLILTGLLTAQVLNKVFISAFERTITPTSGQTTAISNLWNAVDAQKTNTTLRLIRIERTTGGTTFAITAVEDVQVKTVEN